MDSDGEDDPKKIKEIIKFIDKNPNEEIITMNRTLRKESILFSILYEIHLFVTFLITNTYGLEILVLLIIKKRIINCIKIF